MEEYTGEFSWDLPTNKKEILVEHGDIRYVDLTVECVVEWSDKIVADYDSETDTILEYTSGYVMKVLPNQSFVYNGQESTLIAKCLIDKK